jgi:hypothetical protein
MEEYLREGREEREADPRGAAEEPRANAHEEYRADPNGLENHPRSGS